ncbi:MAG: hypothetical protein IH819_11540 [Bacteroidetes bacterium]|nr:hypothetical protein [Bacteroidota bacterium]
MEEPLKEVKLFKNNCHEDTCYKGSLKINFVFLRVPAWWQAGSSLCGGNNC